MLLPEYLEQLGSLHNQMGAKPKVNHSATIEALAAVGVLDPELRAAWAVADGAAPPFFARPGYLTPFAFLGTRAALEQRQAMAKRAPRYVGYQQPRQRDPRIRPGWFEDGWMPFGSFAGGTCLLISDGAPTSSGTVGQVIAFIHDPDEIVFVSPSFGEFLQASLAAMRADCEEYFVEI